LKKDLFILTEDLHVQDPHEIFLTLFESSNDEPVLFGTITQFIKRTILIVLALIGLRALFESYLPGISEIAIALILGIISVFFVTYFVKNLIPVLLSKKTGMVIRFGLATTLFIVVGVTLGIG